MKRVWFVISNGFPWGIYFFCLSYGIGVFLPSVTRKELMIFSLVTAVLAIFCNGLVYQRFRKSDKHLKKITVDEVPGESPIAESTAGYRVDDELILGKLIISERYLIFQANVSSAGSHQRYVWNLVDLKGDRFYPSIWNSGGVFKLVSSDGGIHFFDVSDIKPFKRYFRTK